MQLIYVAGKYTAKTRQEIKSNIQVAEIVAKDLLLLGFIPIIPHKITSFFPEMFTELSSWEDDDWLVKFCIPLIKRCDAIVFSTNWTHSRGAAIERAYAVSINKPSFYSVPELKIYMDGLIAEQKGL